MFALNFISVESSLVSLLFHILFLSRLFQFTFYVFIWMIIMHIAHVGISIVHIGVQCGRWIFSFIAAYVPDKEYILMRMS